MKTKKADLRGREDRRSDHPNGAESPTGAERRVDARRLLDEIEVRQQELDAVTFKKPSDGRNRRRLLVFAIALSSGILGLDLYTQEPSPPVFSESELDAGLDFLVYLTVQGLEEFRERTGALPTTLEQAGLDDPSIRYDEGISGFRIEAQEGSRSVVFTEGDDVEPLAASFWALQRRGPE